jgi:adenylate cyclase class 2
MSNYEVEQKFKVSDLSALERRLAAMGVSVAPAQAEVDQYFAHPARDFAETDEALRIRRKGGRALITYKGPKVDQTTKTRREIELPLGADEESAAAWAGLLQVLHFTPVAEVFKSRRKAFIPWKGQTVEASLDDVRGVGTYAELELVVDEKELDAARTLIASLAAELELTDNERRSYMELLLEGQAKGSGFRVQGSGF